MKRMKTLTVGGETYQITDPEAARLQDGTVDEQHVWSGKYLLERLCPAFSQTGSIVRCLPAEGYPMTVTAPDAQTITRCGKNLFDTGVDISLQTYANKDNAQISRYGYKISLPAGTYTIHTELAEGASAGGYIYFFVNDAEGNYKEHHTTLTSKSVTFTLAAGDVMSVVNGSASGYISSTKDLFAKYHVQIEAGSVVTPYESYRGDTFACDGSPLMPWVGVNTFWPDAGSITVSGRADIAGMNEELRYRLAALEAALVNT